MLREEAIARGVADSREKPVAPDTVDELVRAAKQAPENEKKAREHDLLVHLAGYTEVLAERFYLRYGRFCRAHHASLDDVHQDAIHVVLKVYPRWAEKEEQAAKSQTHAHFKTFLYTCFFRHGKRKYVEPLRTEKRQGTAVSLSRHSRGSNDYDGQIDVEDTRATERLTAAEDKVTGKKILDWLARPESKVVDGFIILLLYGFNEHDITAWRRANLERLLEMERHGLVNDRRSGKAILDFNARLASNEVLTTEDIGPILGMTPQRVRVRHARALKALLQFLEPGPKAGEEPKF